MAIGYNGRSFLSRQNQCKNCAITYSSLLSFLYVLMEADQFLNVAIRQDLKPQTENHTHNFLTIIHSCLCDEIPQNLKFQVSYCPTINRNSHNVQSKLTRKKREASVPKGATCSLTTWMNKKKAISL